MYSRETQALMEAAVDAIVVIDHRGVMTDVNASTCRMLGYTTEELLGKNVGMLMPEADRSAHDEYMRRYLDTGTARIIGIGRQVTARRKDGTVFPARLTVGRVPDSVPPRFVGFLRDVTEENEREQNLHLAQDRLTRVARLATLGEMTAGIAHELNQPLTAITTYARACERYLEMGQPDMDEIREALREINAEGLRAGEVIRRLRRMSRADTADEHTTIEMNALFDELRSLMSSDARAHEARLAIDIEPDLPPVTGNAVQLQQVLLNLLRNALEALLECPAGSREVMVSAARTLQGEVELRVTDNGPGIEAGIRDSLFDPFSTTKPSGTGLGLAISRTIVQGHRGTIEARPAPSRGTTFVVRLPAMEVMTR